MKRIIPRMKKETRSHIIRAADGLLSVASLLFLFNAVALISSKYSSDTNYLIVYVLMAVSNLLMAAEAFRKDKLEFVKNICFAVALLAAGAIVFIMGLCYVSFVIMMEAFLAVIFANRILGAISTRQLRSRLLNILFALIIGYIAISTFFVDDVNLADFMLIHAVMVSGKVLGHIIAISFSQMRFSVLRKILRKTFAGEILFGQALLILSFSFVFQALEPGIETYYDGLWYCFAVVTTIGFGDLTVVTPFSRVLSVILGMYGIVVVALITSVIVNFYNEVKDEAEEKDAENVKEAPAEELPAQTEEKTSAASDTKEIE